MPRVANVNSLPGSANSTRQVVDHCRAGSKLSPVKVVWSSSSHCADLQTGLNSPMRVMSATSAYTASGGAPMVTESECWYFVRSIGGAYGVPVAFTGWPVEAVEFFEALEDDNSRTFWQANKTVYERCVKGPMEGLLAELEDEFGAGKVFRPYRDVRFSRDKTPYKLSCAA